MSTRYNTQNPIESDDVRDMSDNAKNLDLFSNSSELSFADRLGVERQTIYGMNSEFNDQILSMGFSRVGTFSSGATLTNPRQTLLWDTANGGDGQEYGWSGTFPKIVPPSSTPASTGGISVGAWMSRFDPELRIMVRESLRRSYAEAGYKLVDGSFEAGGTVSSATDVIMLEVDGKAYSWGGALPKVVHAGSSPSSTGGVGTGAWVDRSDVTLRSELAAHGGAGLVGGVITPITSKSLAGGAVAGQDSTAAISAAGAIGGSYWVPKGEYIISSATVSKDITFIFEEGAVFKRAPGLDIHQRLVAPGATIIDVVADGLTIKFVDPIFDGNKTNQPAVQVGYSGVNATTEPTGYSFRYVPVNPATAKDCKFIFERPRFKNGTSGYLLIRGDDINRRFRTSVVLIDPIFSSTIYGYGANDPATPNPLGWSSDYVSVNDYVDLYGTNVDMSYDAIPTPVGRYAPVGIRGSYSRTIETAGGASIYLFGATKLKGLGRKIQHYDGLSYNNNAIGAIDGYGDCQNLYVEQLEATDCEFVSLRGKVTLDNYYVGKAALVNCKHGLQVSSGSQAAKTNIYVGSVKATGGVNPQVDFTGNSTSDRIPSVYIGTCDVSGGVNEEGLTNVGGVVARFVKRVTGGMLEVSNQDDKGILMQFCDYATLACDVKNTVKAGVTLDSISTLIRANCVVKNVSAGHGVTILGTCTTVEVDAVVDGAVDYGVNANISAGNVSIKESFVDNITGLSRGYYVGAAGGAITNSKVGTAVTTPTIFSKPFSVTVNNCNWQARNNLFSSSALAPTSGEFRRGDIIYIPATPGGYVGWICTTAGTAGSTAVFKQFGAILA